MTPHEVDIAFNFLKVYVPQQWRVRKLLDALKVHDIRLICFGSSVKGTATPFSDLDLCIETKKYSRNYFRYLHRLISLTYLEPELPNNAVDVLYYNDLKPESSVKESIDTIGVILKDFKETYR